MPGHTARRRGPRYSYDEGSHDYIFFRGSIAGLRHSLSTLRSRGCPRTTPDSLPAADQLYRMGLITHRIPTKGFHDASYIASSFPRLS